MPWGVLKNSQGYGPSLGPRLPGICSDRLWRPPLLCSLFHAKTAFVLYSPIFIEGTEAYQVGRVVNFFGKFGITKGISRLLLFN